jgi:hypothetical protein
VTNKASGDPAGKPIGVFVLDDHEIVRQGVRACWRLSWTSG